jgi:hypothetical protein
MPAETSRRPRSIPKKRRALRVVIEDELETDRILNELMGKDAAGTLPLHHGQRGQGGCGSGPTRSPHVRWPRTPEHAADLTVRFLRA